MTPNGLWIFDARKAKDAAAKIVAHFSAQSLEEALREAFDASTITHEPARIFIPSRSKPDLLVKFLQEPEKYTGGQLSPSFFSYGNGYFSH